MSALQWLSGLWWPQLSIRRGHIGSSHQSSGHRRILACWSYFRKGYFVLRIEPDIRSHCCKPSGLFVIFRTSNSWGNPSSWLLDTVLYSGGYPDLYSDANHHQCSHRCKGKRNCSRNCHWCRSWIRSPICRPCFRSIHEPSPFVSSGDC